MTCLILSSTAWKIGFGGLDAGSGRRADMELDLPAVDEREEVAPDEHEHCRPKPQHGTAMAGTMTLRLSKTWSTPT